MAKSNCEYNIGCSAEVDYDRAYNVYTGPLMVSSERGDKDPAVLYRRIFGRSRPVTVEFLGVWVSYGRLNPRSFGLQTGHRVQFG
jgi:hypothetical protein